MSTNICDIRDQLKTNYRNQRTPITYSDDDYLEIAILGCKRLYRDTGIQSQWSSDYSSGATPTLNVDLDLNQYEYCLKSSEIELVKSIRAFWSTMVSYTTNALSVTNAFKPFDFLNQTIKEKEIELIDLFHKMTETSTATSIDSVDVVAVDYNYES